MFDTLMASGILTRAMPAADRTERWDGSKHPAILKACDDFFAYNECGWSCLVGYQSLRDTDGKVYDRRRVLNVHFNSDGERAGALMGQGLETDGRSVYRLTEAQIAERRRARKDAGRGKGRYGTAYYDD